MPSSGVADFSNTLLELFSEEGKNVSVRLDGKEIGKINNNRQLNKGIDFNLEDGSVLRFESSGDVFNPDLCIFINGKPVPGSAIKAGPYSIIFFLLFIIISKAIGDIINPAIISNLGKLIPKKQWFGQN